jgi:hypothetical protein
MENNTTGNEGYASLHEFITKRGEPVYLDAEDIGAIYRIFDRQNHINDAKMVITEKASSDYFGEAADEHDKICDAIGLTPNEIADMFADTAVDQFEKRHDWNISNYDQWEYIANSLLDHLSNAYRILKKKAQELFDNCSEYDNYGNEKDRRIEKYARNLMLAQSVDLYKAFIAKWSTRFSGSMTRDDAWESVIDELLARRAKHHTNNDTEN